VSRGPSGPFKRSPVNIFTLSSNDPPERKA
jgi:hypothetical protein